jgi:protein-S-isoprenylcysteine O-methyltransferase Ste14
VTRFRFQGTGETVGGSPGPALIVIAVLLLCGSGGAVAAVAAAVVDALIAVVVVVVLVVAALAAYLVHLARHPGSLPRVIVPAPSLHELPAPERPAIGPKPELHLHFHGADPVDVAEILRRHGED